jgi:hypothetical protein
MIKRLVAEFPLKQLSCAGSELPLHRLRECALADAVSYYRRSCVDHRSRDTSNMYRPVQKLGHKLNPRVRNACPIVRILTLPRSDLDELMTALDVLGVFFRRVIGLPSPQLTVFGFRRGPRQGHGDTIDHLH